MKFFKSDKYKLFKNNILISAVALLECLILIAVSTYSWIESTSSLVIKGFDMPVTSNLNYKMDIDSESTNIVDLSTYFHKVALFELAKTSSYDGETFFFPKQALKSGSAQNSYRQGDTTDFNTNYYSIDFVLHNSTTKSQNFYFDTEDIFTISSDDDTLTTADLQAGADAMRLSVTTGNSTKIYAKSATAYNAVKTVTPTTQSVTPEAFSNGHVYQRGTVMNQTKAVIVSSNGGEDTKVTIRIWFEEKAPTFAALSAAKKTALLGAQMNINLKFVNSASLLSTLFFDDYTMNSTGQNYTAMDDTKQMYFYYSGGETPVAYEMVRTETTDGVTHWATCNQDGAVAPVINDEALLNVKSNYTTGYFFYGTYNSETGDKTEQYRWQFSSNFTYSAPATNPASEYVYNAMSVNYTNSTTNYGFGMWDTTAYHPTLVQFKDQSVGNTTDSYNSSGYRFIDNTEGNSMYVSKDTNIDVGAAGYKAVSMYHDTVNGVWKGYVPNSYITNNSIYFIYSKTAYFAPADTVLKWSAQYPEPRTQDGTDYIYTALGYTNATTISALPTSGTTGVGTWEQVEKVKFSTELIDNDISPDYRYRIGAPINASIKYYYMTNDSNNLEMFAYVPVGAGNSTNRVSFQRFATPTATNASCAWNDTNHFRDGSDTFYATNHASTATGQWHIGVVVDGTIDNLVNDVLTTNAGDAKLEYSTDNTTFHALTQLDNSRWYTPDLGSAVTTIYYRWTAYVEDDNDNDTVFNYVHDVSDGIYMTITE